MLNRKDRYDPKREFSKISEINLSQFKDKGYTSIYIKPLKNGRIALFLTFKHETVDVLVIDSITEDKITFIPNLNQIFGVKNISCSSTFSSIYINELPNGNIILSHDKKHTIVWSVSLHTIIQTIQKTYKSVAEINEHIFALLDGREIEFYNKHLLHESKANRGLPSCFFTLPGTCEAIVGLPGNTFVMFKNNLKILYKIKQNQVTQQESFKEKGEIHLATYIQKRGELLVIKKILDPKRDDQFTLRTFKENLKKPTLHYNLGNLGRPCFSLLPGQEKVLVQGYEFKYKSPRHNQVDWDKGFLSLCDLSTKPKPRAAYLAEPGFNRAKLLTVPPAGTCYIETGQFLLYSEWLHSTTLQCLIPNFYVTEFIALSNERRRLLIQRNTALPSGIAHIIGEYAGLFADKRYGKVGDSKDNEMRATRFSGQRRGASEEELDQDGAKRLRVARAV